MSAGWLALPAIPSSAQSHRFGRPSDLDFVRQESCSSCRGLIPCERRWFRRGRGSLPTPGQSRLRVPETGHLSAGSHVFPLAIPARSILYRRAPGRHGIGSALPRPEETFINRMVREHRWCHFPREAKTFRPAGPKGLDVLPRHHAGAQFPAILGQRLSRFRPGRISWILRTGRFGSLKSSLRGPPIQIQRRLPKKATVAGEAAGPDRGNPRRPVQQYRLALGLWQNRTPDETQTKTRPSDRQR